MLPMMNGLDVCREIRRFNKEVPIIVVTALDQTEDIVEAFKRDADDYITKPFRMEELKAKIHRQLRKTRENNNSNNTIEIADLSLDRVAKLASRGGENISLTATEYRLLEYLMVNRNKIISRMDIHLFKGLGFGVGFSHVSARRMENFVRIDDQGNEVWDKWPAYLNVNSALYYHLRGVRISINANNLLDKYYYIGGFDYTRGFVGAPRNFMLSLSYRFR